MNSHELNVILNSNVRVGIVVCCHGLLVPACHACSIFTEGSIECCIKCGEFCAIGVAIGLEIIRSTWEGSGECILDNSHLCLERQRVKPAVWVEVKRLFVSMVIMSVFIVVAFFFIFIVTFLIFVMSVFIAVVVMIVMIVVTSVVVMSFMAAFGHHKVEFQVCRVCESIFALSLNMKGHVAHRRVFPSIQIFDEVFEFTHVE